MNIENQRRVANIVLSEFEKISNIRSFVKKAYEEHKDKYFNPDMKRRNEEAYSYLDDKGESINKTLDGAGFWYLQLNESLLSNIFRNKDISDEELKRELLTQLSTQDINLWKYLPLDNLYIQAKYSFRGHRFPNRVIFAASFLSPGNIVITEERYEEQMKHHNNDASKAFPYRFFYASSPVELL